MCMRLIDAHAAEKMCHDPSMYIYDLTDTPAFLAECPTVDAAPIRHGQWSEKMVTYKDEHGDMHAGFQCSECQGIFNKTKFCGGCGALMDKQRKERHHGQT